MTTCINLLVTLIFITSPVWTATCPGSQNCQTCEVSANDIYYLHYGIIEDLDLSSILPEPEPAIITCKNPSNRSDLSDLKYYADFKHTIKSVTITNVKVTTVPHNLFSRASSLEYLDLSRNQISFISNKLFEDCTNLNTLNLSSNHLSVESFSSGLAFPGLRRLEILDLSNNLISSLDSNLLSGLSSLRHLYMSNNNMKYIDYHAFSSITRLRSLDFSHNALTLKTEYIFDMGLGPMSPFHHSQNTLQEINLAYNNIDRIFGDWVLSTNLKILNLSHNHLSNVEDSNFQFLSNKIYVDLSFNHIDEIKYGKIGSLENNNYDNMIVNVENNHVQCGCNLNKMLLFLELLNPTADKKMIDSAVDRFKCDNQKQEISNSVCKMDNVFEQLFGKCPSRCDCGIKPKSKTILVDCSYRNLNRAPDTIPSFTGFVAEVDLTGNHLTRIPSKNQKGYNHVTVLALSNNKITNIPKDLPFDKLEKLYLDNNNLAKIDNEIFDLLRTSTKLKNLSLHDNKLKCTCEARNFTVFIQIMEEKFPELRNVTCYGYDLPVYKINLNKFCLSTHYWIVAICIVFSIVIAISGMILAFCCTKNHNRIDRRNNFFEISRPTIHISDNKNDLKSVFVV